VALLVLLVLPVPVVTLVLPVRVVLPGPPDRVEPQERPEAPPDPRAALVKQAPRGPAAPRVRQVRRRRRLDRIHVAGGDADVRGDAGGKVVFSRNVRVNDDTGKGMQSEVALAAGGGMLLAGWMDERATRVCGFSFSSDGGLTWSKNVSIPNATGSFVGDPAVAIDGGGTMYAVCQEYLNVGTTGNIRMMTSTDKGVTWSAIRTIQSAPDKPWAGGGIAEGTVFVSWLGNAAGIKRSVDRGVTWGAIQSLGNIIHGTAIVTSTTGLVHVPYNLDSANNQLRYLRSKDNGVAYDAYRDLVADMGTFCFSCSPRQHPIVGAASDPTGKFVAITWTSVMPGGQSDDDVWLLYSKDSGDTWTRPLRVNDNTNASRQFESWVAVDDYGRVHVAWTDLRNGQNETWYARSADPTVGSSPPGKSRTDAARPTSPSSVTTRGSSFRTDVIATAGHSQRHRDIYAQRAGAVSVTGAAPQCRSRDWRKRAQSSSAGRSHALARRSVASQVGSAVASSHGEGGAEPAQLRSEEAGGTAAVAFLERARSLRCTKPHQPSPAKASLTYRSHRFATHRGH
jgi:hypothetical protein